MSSAAENKKLMEAIFEGLAVGDSKLFVESMSDDITVRLTGQHSWARTFTGKATLLKDLYGYLRSLLAERPKTIPVSFVADGDTVIVEARGSMLTKTGVRYDNEYCNVYRFSGGKIVEIREYGDSMLTESALGKFPA